MPATAAVEHVEDREDPRLVRDATHLDDAANVVVLAQQAAVREEQMRTESEVKLFVGKRKLRERGLDVSSLSPSRLIVAEKFLHDSAPPPTQVFRRTKIRPKKRVGFPPRSFDHFIGDLTNSGGDLGCRKTIERIDRNDV